MAFDEEPEGDPHGECAKEIHELQGKVATLSRENLLFKQKTERLSELYNKAQRQLDFYKDIAIRSRTALGKLFDAAKGVIKTIEEARK